MDERPSSERLTTLCSQLSGKSMVFAREWDFPHTHGTPMVAETPDFRNRVGRTHAPHGVTVPTEGLA